MQAVSPTLSAITARGRVKLQGYLFDVHTGVLASVGRDGLEPID